MHILLIEIAEATAHLASHFSACILQLPVVHVPTIEAKVKACQGKSVGHALGGGCGQIKAFEISLFTYPRNFCTKGLLG